jgi:ribosomal protein L29
VLCKFWYCKVVGGLRIASKRQQPKTLQYPVSGIAISTYVHKLSASIQSDVNKSDNTQNSDHPDSLKTSQQEEIKNANIRLEIENLKLELVNLKLEIATQKLEQATKKRTMSEGR